MVKKVAKKSKRVVGVDGSTAVLDLKVRVNVALGAKFPSKAAIRGAALTLMGILEPANLGDRSGPFYLDKFRLGGDVNID